MSIKQNIYSGITFLILVFGSMSAHAVSYDSGYQVARYNTKGYTSKRMATHSSHFCFLTNVEIQETDTGGESARCFIGWGSGNYYLHAMLGKSSDADVSCHATCFNN